MFAKNFSLRFKKSMFWQSSFWQQWVRVARTTDNSADNSIDNSAGHSPAYSAALSPRKIYIIPTRWGILYGVMLLSLLVGSINYSVSLGFFITFLLASLANIAMLHTWRNLVHLNVQVLQAKPVFAGDTAIITTQMSDPKNRARYAIVAHFANNTLHKDDIARNASQHFSLSLATTKRGYLTCPRLTLYTEFPLSLFHAWAYVETAFQVMVYPQAKNYTLLPSQAADTNAEGNHVVTKGDDEFNGHKSYQIGDAISRVDWKASSRGLGMLSKQYGGNGHSTVWLDWQATAGLAHEARISQLTYWVITAYAAQQTFGLNLPNQTINPNNTEAHYHQALTALALL